MLKDAQLHPFLTIGSHLESLIANMLSPWGTRDVGKCGQIGIDIGGGGAQGIVEQRRAE